jgi:rod shape-determining protein MreC
MLRLTVPPRVVAQRLGFVLLVAAALILMMVGRADTALVERFRVVVSDTAAPVLTVLSQPIVAFNHTIDEVGGLIYLRRENTRLREENARLLRWQAAARRFEQQNAAFRALLGAQTGPGTSFISARVISDSGGPFVRTLLLSAGARDGVVKGQVAVTGEGLVGHVVETGKRASRILLLTDLNSRVPVLIQGTRKRAILVGDNRDWPALAFLSDGPPVRLGDRVVTSGDGGLLPAGLPVGVIAVAREGDVRVQPLVRSDRLEYVRIVRYDLPALATDGSLE